jgi:sugar transferase (PEP-CTERM/EpsH1 system associated)
MKILLLTQVVPYPPDSGPKIKTYHVLRFLAQRHDVHLVSFVRGAPEQAEAMALGRFCSGVTTVPIQRSRARDVASLAHSLLVGLPFLIDRDDSRAMRNAIGGLLAQQRFDAVHADQLSMAQFAVGLPLPLRVLDEHNAVWSIVRRAAAWEGWGPRRALAELEWRKLRAYEGDICRRFDRVTVVSEQDRLALSEAAGAPLATDVIPIAVDTEELAFSPRPPGVRNVLSVATMFYPPNVEGIHWFATEVFPSIRRAVPAAEFSIVGARPPAHIRRLASAGSGIQVTGFVRDLEPILRSSALLVVPLHAASGMRVKILEAFARGIPIVSTTVGVEGIDAEVGEHLLVADSPADFAAAVIRLLQTPEESVRLANAGRSLVEARYDWRTALAPLHDIYPDGTQAPPPGTGASSSRASEESTPARERR